MSIDQTWIGRCNECGFEGRIKPVEEELDEDCKINVFYCPNCGMYITSI